VLFPINHTVQCFYPNIRFIIDNSELQHNQQVLSNFVFLVRHARIVLVECDAIAWFDEIFPRINPMLQHNCNLKQLILTKELRLPLLALNDCNNITRVFKQLIVSHDSLEDFLEDDSIDNNNCKNSMNKIINALKPWSNIEVLSLDISSISDIAYLLLELHNVFPLLKAIELTGLESIGVEDARIMHKILTECKCSSVAIAFDPDYSITTWLQAIESNHRIKRLTVNNLSLSHIESINRNISIRYLRAQIDQECVNELSKNQCLREIVLQCDDEVDPLPLLKIPTLRTLTPFTFQTHESTEKLLTFVQNAVGHVQQQLQHIQVMVERPNPSLHSLISDEEDSKWRSIFEKASHILQGVSFSYYQNCDMTGALFSEDQEAFFSNDSCHQNDVYWQGLQIANTVPMLATSASLDYLA
jgi:hypothetical protein